MMQKLARALSIPIEHSRYSLMGIAVCLLAVNVLTLAQGRTVRVARVSLVEGEVNVQRAEDKRDEWFEATANLPLNENDQLYSGGNGRAEVQLTGGNLARLNRDTNFKITQFNNSTMQFALSIGTATFRIGNLDRRKLQTVDASEADNDQPIYFEVDSPVVAVTLLREGSYRINVTDDGTTELVVRRGAAEVYNKDLGTIAIKEGRRIIVEGTDPSLYQVRKVDDKDDWDRWNERRDDELFARAQYHSIRHVPAHIPGVYDLDLYGDWYEAPGYGWVWSPRVVAAGWAPYRTGSWRWYPSYGWTWIGYEPWGWVPYHYGRWAYWGSRWCWVPRVSFGISFGWSWSPGLVAFYGSRGGYGRGYRDGFSDGYRRGYRDGAYDWIGWVPLAPGEQDQRSVSGRETAMIARANLLKNYAAPGGVSGLNGREFEKARVVVREIVGEPTRSGATRSVEVLPVQVDEVKPRNFDAPRTVQIARSSTGRDLGAPVVVRRSPVQTGTTDGVDAAGTRPVREQADSPARGERENPARATGSGESAVSPSALNGVNRPSRVPDFTPAERPLRPVRSAESRILRDQSAPTDEVSVPRQEQSNPSPTRSQVPRQIESAPPERSARPERVERPAPSRSEEPRRIERQQESAPRQTSPPPAPKPDPPPAARPERSQPAQERSRESAPSRPVRP